MSKRLWIILGATSIIAQEFAHLAAQAGHSLLLVGRNKEQLDIIAADMTLRHHISCDLLVIDLSSDIALLLHILNSNKREMDLFIAHSHLCNNDALTPALISDILSTNVLNTCQIIHTYLNRAQKKHHVMFLSSVAARRGRSRNSLYGGSKAAIEIYLQGLQQSATKHQLISIARLGFIDTQQTYGMPGIFYAAKPENCARTCWHALQAKKTFFYYPRFWRLIMMIIGNLPLVIYKKMEKI